MMKIRILEDVNINGTIISKDNPFIKVSDEIGTFLTRKTNARGVIIKQKAVETGTISMDNLTKEHIDYTHL